MSVTAEYCHFIKTVLVNLCYSSYCESVYTKDDYPIEEYRDKLLEYKYDSKTWRRVFSNKTVSDVLKYYLKLTDNEQLYPHHKSVTVYNNISFHQYVNTIVLPYLSSAEYDKYITLLKLSADGHTMSKKDAVDFKKLENKYRLETVKRGLKNHLIYRVNLIVLHKVDNLTMFLEDEKKDIDIGINVVPFFEYIGEIGLTLEDIDAVANEQYSAEFSVDQIKEFNVFRIIRERFLWKEGGSVGARDVCVWCESCI